MAMTNIQTGRQKVVKTLGLKELQQNVNSLIDATTSEEATKIAIAASRAVLSQVKVNAASVNLPKLAMDDLFIYAKPQGNDKSSVTTLVGLRKKGNKIVSRGYRVWNAGTQRGAFKKIYRTGSVNARTRALVSGRKIGENLGTMWEQGTTKMAPRVWFRTAITTARTAVYGIFQAGYTDIMQKYGNK